MCHCFVKKKGKVLCLIITVCYHFYKGKLIILDHVKEISGIYPKKDYPDLPGWNPILSFILSICFMHKAVILLEPSHFSITPKMQLGPANQTFPLFYVTLFFQSPLLVVRVISEFFLNSNCYWHSTDAAIFHTCQGFLIFYLKWHLLLLPDYSIHHFQ